MANQPREKSIFLSLIVATVGRSNELVKLLQSLVKSEYTNFEVIIVDQNEDHRLTSIVQCFKEKLFIKHVRISEKNASRARNVGASYALGTWLGFPDDDCCYTPLTTKTVINTTKRTTAELVSGVVLDYSGKSLNRYYIKRGRLYFLNFVGKVPEPSLFIRKRTYCELGGYNEDFGPGAKYFSSESHELVARAMKKKKKVLFNAAIEVIHPRKLPPFDANAILKGYFYSYGFGRVMRRYYGAWAFFYIIKYLAFFTIKMFFHKDLQRKFTISSCKGLFDGFLHWPINSVYCPEANYKVDSANKKNFTSTYYADLP